MQPGTVSVTREIADLEAEVAKYEASHLSLGEKLLSVSSFTVSRLLPLEL